MLERPKSREETPKEGDGSARENLSLPHCNNIHRDAQNASPVDLFARRLSPKIVQFCRLAALLAIN